MQNICQQFHQNILVHDQVVANQTIWYTMASVSSNIPVKQTELNFQIQENQ